MKNALIIRFCTHFCMLSKWEEKTGQIGLVHTQNESVFCSSQFEMICDFWMKAIQIAGFHIGTEIPRSESRKFCLSLILIRSKRTRSNVWVWRPLFFRFFLSKIRQNKGQIEISQICPDLEHRYMDSVEGLHSKTVYYFPSFNLYASPEIMQIECSIQIILRSL